VVATLLAAREQGLPQPASIAVARFFKRHLS